MPVDFFLEEAVLRLRQGEVIAFPTETVFGLGVDPSSEKGVEYLLELKDREAGVGVPLVAGDESQIERWVRDSSDEVKTQRLALQSTFWPGPLTLVVDVVDEAEDEFSAGIFGPERSLGIRVSESGLARELANRLGGLICATSANPRGEDPAMDAAQAKAYFPELFILEGGDDRNLSHPVPSTIIDVRRYPFSVIREGAVRLEAIASWLRK